MMLAVPTVLGALLPKDGLADAHDAGWLEILWQRTPQQLMLMTLAGLQFFGEGCPS